MYKQLVLPGVEPVETVPPPARRIVERIVRGLIATQNAVREQSVEALVHSYQGGFNSNMCQAVVNISSNKEANVEYSILWSPKIPPSEDIANVGSILLNGMDYSYLERAASDMKKLEEEKSITVRGIVEGLTSPDDPHKFGVGQSIVVKWENPDLGRIVKIIIDLNPEEYLKAIDAHEYFRSVIVTGVAKQIGSKWKLFGPENFHVAP